VGKSTTQWLSIYPLLITTLVFFKNLLLVAIVLLIYPAYQSFGIFQTFITSGHCVVELPTASYRFGIFKHLLLEDILQDTKRVISSW
jgi:hypothetical protein